MNMQCPLCGYRDLTLRLPSVYTLHLIDAHWDLMERIRRTTGDEPARLRLAEELQAELEAKKNHTERMN